MEVSGTSIFRYWSRLLPHIGLFQGFFVQGSVDAHSNMPIHGPVFRGGGNFGEMVVISPCKSKRYIHVHIVIESIIE